MLVKDEIILKMEQRGFTINSYSMDNGKIIAIHFMSKEEYVPNTTRIRTPSFACNVNLKNEEFDFAYVVPYSINTLRSPKCSPVTKDDHFDKILNKFADQVHVLYRYFGKD